MKVSEITNKEIAEYLKLDFATLTDQEKTDLNTLLTVAKAYIKSYTGLGDITVTGENIGIGDGITTTFYLDNIPVVPGSQTIYIGGIPKVKDTDYTFYDAAGKIVFVTAPPISEVITGSYKAGIDAYEDFIIVVYVLCQDMHDNRTLYVDKSNLNKVVDTILGMHCINLL